MVHPKLHSFKSTESSSYEIMYSILDCVDAINEANSRLDKGEGDFDESMNQIFKGLKVMTAEVDSLVKYWWGYRNAHHTRKKQLPT